jgi:glycosyltransferase involved in cell wall biosynthesis
MGDGSLSKTRVLLLHNFLTPYRIPLFAELARRFDFEVWILGDVRKIRDWPGEAPQGAFRHRSLPCLEIPLGSRYNVLMLNYSLPWALARQQADVIICCGWDSPALVYAALHARLTGTPFVLWSGSTPSERSLARTLSLPAVKGLVRLGDAWIAYGSRAKEYLVQLGAERRQVFRAFNTVALDFFAQGAELTDTERDALRAQLGIETRHVVLYCGNLLELKGLEDLMPAFAEVARQRDDVTLLLVGSGPDETKYRAFCDAAGLGERVVFAGFVDRTQLPPYYGIADLLVLPSRSEVWGLVINEAMACGVPVLTTDVVGAVPDLLQEGINGYVVPVRHPDALCDAMLRFFADGTDRDAMSRAARTTVRPFTCAHMADAFEAAVHCALGRG